MGIFGKIRERRDPGVLKELNGYLNFHTRLAELDETIRFFEDCIRSNHYPRQFWKQLRRNRIKPDNVTLRRHTSNYLDTLKPQAEEFRRIIALKEPATSTLPDSDRLEFLEYVQRIAEKRILKKRITLDKSLIEPKPRSAFPSNPGRYVHNLSSAVLDDTLLEVLSLGPKFCCPHAKIDQISIATQFENLYNQTYNLTASSPIAVDQFKSDLVNCCYQYAQSKISTGSPLTRKHLDALKELRTRDDILLSRPDKGAGIVVLNKCDYITKMMSILNDDSKFQRSKDGRDRTTIAEDQLTACLRRLRNQNVISEEIFGRLKPTGTIVPRLYGLPKIHKPNVPLRPILDMCNSPYHETAKWLAEILEPLRLHLCKLSLRDSFEFVDLIEDINMNNKQMCSFDVSSLFTNVPLLQTVNFICEYIDAFSVTLPIPTASLKELLLRCTFNIQFKFDGTLYNQIDGVAMGSPLGPLLSDIFMSSLEQGFLCDTIRSMPFYRRYVDDVFIILDNHTDISPVLELFNNAHPAIRFTSELENNGVLNFLDVLLSKRPDGSLQRSVFRKSTWTGQYTHFLSFVPLRQKRNLVKTLTHRAKRICTPDTIALELKHITEVLRENGYPERFVSRNMNLDRPADPISKAERKPIFLSLPFKGDHLTTVINRRIHNSLQRTFPAATLKSFATTRPLINFNLKDKLPVHSHNMVVYSFVCSCTAEYVGRTTRQLKTRISEHHPRWLKLGEQKSIRSSVVSHLVESGHTIDPATSFRIIYEAPRNLPGSIRSRYITTAEAVAIRLREPTLCNQKRFVQALNLPWPFSTVRSSQSIIVPDQSSIAAASISSFTRPRS